MENKIIFSPMNIGNVTIKNRVVMSPMMLNLGQINGNVTMQMADYYEERAKGGAGLIITEIARVNDKHGASSMGQLSVSHDYNIPSLKSFAERIHSYGTKLFVQLHHPGRQNLSLMINTVPVSIFLDKVFNNYKNLIWKIIPLGKKMAQKGLWPFRSVSASKVAPSCFAESKVAKLSRLAIKRLIKQFIDAAIRVQQAGCDGVELHGTHGYLIQQFISPYTNRRTDEYGGSFENRMRFVSEIIDGIKNKCGNDFPVIVRFSADECYDKINKAGQGYGLEEGIEIARYLAKHKVDALDVSCASYDTFNYWLEPTSFPCGWRKYMAKAVKEAVNIPIIAANLIRSVEQAEAQIEDGVQDFVSLGRPHIADPFWTEKAEKGEVKDIKRCICCLHCFESMMTEAFKGGHASCSVNPAIGIERLVNNIKKDGKGRKVVVVGAGVAGMTCAEWLAKRNFDVTVLEKEREVGGQLQLASKPPCKEKISWCYEDLYNCIKKLGVEVILNKEADKKTIEKYKPYAVILATGADAVIPKFAVNSKNKNIYTTTDILNGSVKLNNKNIVIIGSGLTGLETAELLSETQNKISIVEMAEKVAPNIWFQHRDDILPKLIKAETQLLTGYKFIRVTENGIIILNLATHKEMEIKADAIILSMGVKSNTKLMSELKSTEYQVFRVGDAKKCGNIATATKDAFNIACNLD